MGVHMYVHENKYAVMRQATELKNLVFRHKPTEKYYIGETFGGNFSKIDFGKNRN